MALNATSFANQVINDTCMIDFRRENTVLPVVMESEESRKILDWFAKMGPTSGFAAAININRMVYSGSALDPSCADGYTQVVSFPSSVEDPDLSAAYGAATTEIQQYKIDKFAIGTHRLPAVHRLLNSAGPLIRENKLMLDIKVMMNKMEEGFINDMISSSTPASVNAGTATNFTLRTGSEANLLADLAALDGACNVYNIPQDDRILILPTSTRGKILQYPHLVNSLIMDRQYSNLATAELSQIMGFKLIFTNSAPSTVGLMIALQRVFFIQPVGFIIEDLKAPARLGDYTRVWTLAGWGTTGKIVNAADGDGWSIAREGVFAVTIS
jgi:hypothetical protein